MICLLPATECRTFLLYYLPVLSGILPDRYLAHALLLSKALRLLLGDQVSLADIDISENLLMLFWRLTEEYYGERMSYTYANIFLMFYPGLKHCKINIHLLSHLPHYVRLLGPLWTHSAFAFEDTIGYLVKRAHGTHDVANQVLLMMYLVALASFWPCVIPT